MDVVTTLPTQISLLLDPETVDVLINLLIEFDDSPPGAMWGPGYSDCLISPPHLKALGMLLMHRHVNELIAAQKPETE